VDDINKGFVDKWSAVHTLSGVSMGLLGIAPHLAIPGAIAYEVLEYAHEWPNGSTLFGSKGPETPQNLIGDMALYTGAYFLGRKLSKGANTLPYGVALLVATALLALSYIPNDPREPARVWF
jgi:hypothetical protein